MLSWTLLTFLDKDIIYNFFFLQTKHYFLKIKHNKCLTRCYRPSVCLSFQLVLCLTASAHTHTLTQKIHIISATDFSPLSGCCDHHHYPHIKLPSSLLTHCAISIPVLTSEQNLDSTRRAGSIWYKICWICSPSLLPSPAPPPYKRLRFKFQSPEY